MAQTGIPDTNTNDVGYRFNSGHAGSTGLFASSSTPLHTAASARGLTRNANVTIDIKPVLSLWVDGDSMMSMSKANSQSPQDYFTIVTGSLHATGLELTLGRRNLVCRICLCALSQSLTSDFYFSSLRIELYHLPS